MNKNQEEEEEEASNLGIDLFIYSRSSEFWVANFACLGNKNKIPNFVESFPIVVILLLIFIVSLMLVITEMDFYAMKRKKLQKLCMKHGIRANLKNVEMAERLTLLLKVIKIRPSMFFLILSSFGLSILNFWEEELGSLA